VPALIEAIGPVDAVRETPYGTGDSSTTQAPRDQKSAAAHYEADTQGGNRVVHGSRAVSLRSGLEFEFAPASAAYAARLASSASSVGASANRAVKRKCSRAVTAMRSVKSAHVACGTHQFAQSFLQRRDYGPRSGSTAPRRSARLLGTFQAPSAGPAFIAHVPAATCGRGHIRGPRASSRRW